MRKPIKFILMALTLIMLTVVGLVGCDKTDILGDAFDNLQIEFTVEGDALEKVTGNLQLPTVVGDVTITWSSDNPDVISNDGKVTIPKEDTVVKIVATLTFDGKTKEKTFTITVKGVPDAGDTIAPLLKVVPATVNLEWNEEYDLMEGVSARDNVDGTITDKVQIDDGGFDRTVAGTYTITYTVSDEAGNTSTATRTITVAEKRTTIEIEGKQYQMEYNPQLRPANADSFPFNLEVVTVFEKAYADWLLEHNNQRFAAYWSIVVILDADKKLVEYRTAETNQMNADGSAVGTTWCSGTPTAQNKAYEHRQGMLANLNIPEGGYVIVFINDGANAEGSPRAFGYDQVVNKSFDALGLQFKFNNVDEDAIFNPAKTYPVIKLSEEKIDNRYIPVVELEKGTKATDAFGEDLLGGVSVYHDRETLTAKVHKITKMVEGVETEITKEQIDGNDTSTIYRIKYRATDNVGNVEEETRIFKFVGEGTEEPDPDAIYVTFNGVASLELIQGYEFNENIGYQSKVHQFTKEQWAVISAVVDAPDYAAGTSKYKMANLALFVTDANGKVVAIRLYQKWVDDPQSGIQLTVDADGNIVFEPSGVFSRNNMEIGVNALIPEGGFVYVLATGTPADDEGWSAAMKLGYKYLLGLEPSLLESAFLNGVPFTDWTNPPINPFAADYVITFGSEFVAPDEETLMYVVIGEEKHLVELDKYGWDADGGVGAINTHALAFSKGYLNSLPGYNTPELEDDEGKNYTIKFSILAIIDAEGKVVSIRIHPGHKITWDAVNSKYVVTEGLFTAETMQKDIVADIPDGGFVVLFQNSTAPGNAIRAWGCLHLTGFADVGGAGYANAETGGVANMTVNPFADGFKILFEREVITPEDPEDPEIPEDEMIKNPNFADDMLHWDTYLDGGAATFTPDGENGIKVEITKVGHAWEPRLTQMGIPFEKGKTYKISFEAKALAPKTINLQVGEILKNDPWFTDFKPDIKITRLIGTEWATYEYEFTMDLENDRGGVLFEFGKVDDDITLTTLWLRNIRAEVVEPEIPEPMYVVIGEEMYLVELDTYAWDADGGVGAINTHALAFSKEYLNSLPGYTTETTDDDEGRNYTIQYSILAITDAKGKVVQVRIHPGHKITWDAENNKLVATEGLFTAETMQKDLVAAIPDGGFVILFQNSGAEGNAIRAWGCKQLTGFADVGGTGYANATTGGVANMTVNPFAEKFTVLLKKESEIKDYVTINGEASFKLIYGYDFEKNIAYAEHAIYQFTKEEWQPIAAIVDAEGYDANSNYKLANVALFVTDADGKVVAIRLYQGWTANQAGIQLTVDGEGKIVADTANAFNRNNLEIGLNALIPDGGFVYVLDTGTPGDDLGWSEAMKFGYKHLLGLTPSLFKTAYIYDVPFANWTNPPINPFAAGFKVTFGIEYIEPEPEPEPMYVVIGEEKYPVTLDDYRWDLSSGVGALNNYAVAFSKEYLNSLPGYNTEAADDDEGRKYTIQYSILAIIDAEGKVVSIRIHPGHKITWDADNNKIVATEGLFTAETMQKDIVADIPDGGFVILFQNSGAEGNAIRAWGCKHLTGFADVGGYANADTGGVANMTVNPFTEGFTVLLKKESEIKSYVKISGDTYRVELDNYEWDANGGVGAINTHAIAFSKEYLAALPGYTTADTADDEGRNYTIQYSILAIIDAEGKVVSIRIHPGHKITWDADNNKIVATEGLFTATTMQKDIVADIPDGGFVILFQNSGAEGNAIRAWGCKQLTGFADVGGTGYANDTTGGVANMTVNPFAEGFIIEIIEF